MNTNDKFALISYQQPWNIPLPISADGLDQADNQQLLWGYPGILWSEVSLAVGKMAITFTPRKAEITIMPRKAGITFTPRKAEITIT